MYAAFDWLACTMMSEFSGLLLRVHVPGTREKGWRGSSGCGFASQRCRNACNQRDC